MILFSYMKYTKLFILIFALLVFSACTLNTKIDQTETDTDMGLEGIGATPTEEVIPEEVIEVKEEVVEKEPIEDFTVLIMNSADTLVATLVDVTTDGDANGMAYILRIQGVEGDEDNKPMLYHKLTAELPELTGEDLYEGWLVKQDPELMFISTGVLTKNDEGMYTLDYVSNDLYEGYDFVVVTKETKIDETPEVHILEAIAI